MGSSVVHGEKFSFALVNIRHELLRDRTWPSVFLLENTACVMQKGLGPGLVASLLVGSLVPLYPPAKLKIIARCKEKL
jgi:hypothetical protein